jgi:hypothetical protein
MFFGTSRHRHAVVMDQGAAWMMGILDRTLAQDLLHPAFSNCNMRVRKIMAIQFRLPARATPP